MGTMELFLCFFVGHFVLVHSAIEAFPGFFENIFRFPFEQNFDFSPYDTIFSSWRTSTPDFHMLAELPPVMKVPKVQVSCDESHLTLLVDKKLNGVALSGEDIQLGDGCYSNRELPNQFIFTYSFDQCGTTHSMENGFEIFSNFLHLNLQKPPSAWWLTPLTVHISCMPKRSNPNFSAPKNDRNFDIKAMNSPWTRTAQSNIYQRGQVVNIQLSARTRANEKLFIQSCFVSASPEPQTRPKHAVVLNKGCTAPLGSSHAVIQFVASDRADVVNIALNTTYLISEMYIHCSVLVSNLGVTTGSKSCNYNMIQSRWEELSGNIEVCSCCSSKCKSVAVKRLPEDAKAIVSTGPFFMVDKDEISPAASVSEPQQTSVTDSMQYDAAAPEGAIVTGTSVSRSKLSELLWSSPPQGVVVMSQDPVSRLTIWLPGQVQDAEHGDNIGSQVEDNWVARLQPSNMMMNDLPEPRGEILNKQGNEAPVWDPNVAMLVDGWAIPPQLDQAVVAEESQRKNWFGGSGMTGTEALLAEMNINNLNQNDFNQMKDELAQRQADVAIMHQDGTNDARPIIRSKIQFSKGTDGSQTLSYEEETMKQDEGKCAKRRLGINGIERKQEPMLWRLFSTFLDLFRSTDKAE